MKKEKAKYIYLFVTATIFYFLFLIRGLHNNHYLDWSLDFQIADCIEIMIFTLPMVYFPLKWISQRENYFKDSIWLAFFLYREIFYKPVGRQIAESIKTPVKCRECQHSKIRIVVE